MLCKTFVSMALVFSLSQNANCFASIDLLETLCRSHSDLLTMIGTGSTPNLPNAKMNAVLQISSRVFGKRAEVVIKESSEASCLEDMTLLNITELAIEPRGEHFARNDDDQVCLVIELGVRGNVAGTVRETTGELRLVIVAESDPASANRLTINISFEYDHFELALSIPGLGSELDDEIRVAIEPLLDSIIPVRLQDVFGTNMVLEGEPELTIVGGNNQSSPTLSIGLEISEGESVDRNHFRTSYNQNLLQPAFGYDWALQIESNLMRKKVAEEFLAINVSQVVDIPNGKWVRTKWRKVCWSGECRDWDYHGWENYVNTHYTEHPIWLACAGRIEVEKWGVSLGIPVYWLAWANIDVTGDNLMFDPYVFEADARNLLGYLIPAQAFDIDPIEIGQARFSDDFIINSIAFSTDDLTAYGRDEAEGLPGRAEIEVPQDVAVNLLIDYVIYTSGGKICPDGYPIKLGILEDGVVVSHFDIVNRGEAPLWICSVEIVQDTDNVFDVRLPNPVPMTVQPGDSFTIDVLMDPPPGDHSTHYGSIEIRSNDFNQPRVIIPVHGVKMEEMERPPGSGQCFELPQEFSYEILEAIYELVYGHIRIDIPGIIIPSLPEPEPGPCPECGYYLDIAISGSWPQLQSEVFDPSRDLLERSRSIGNVHFLSIPLSPPERLEFSIKPACVKGPGTMRIRISRVIMIGQWKSELPVTQIAAEREFVHVVTEAGFDTVNIHDPTNPIRISNIDLKLCREVKTRDGYLYALTGRGLEIFDINDPYNPFLAHTIVTGRASCFEFVGKKLVVYEPKKLRVYQVREGATPIWLNEFQSKEEIRGAYKIGRAFVLDVKDGAYVFRSFDSQELALAKPFAMKKIEKMFPDIEGIIRETDRPLKYVLHDEYLLIVPKDRKGFAILRKNPIQYKFRLEAIEKIISMGK